MPYRPRGQFHRATGSCTTPEASSNGILASSLHHLDFGVLKNMGLARLTGEPVRLGIRRVNDTRTPQENRNPIQTASCFNGLCSSSERRESRTNQFVFWGTTRKTKSRREQGARFTGRRFRVANRGCGSPEGVFEARTGSTIYRRAF